MKKTLCLIMTLCLLWVYAAALTEAAEGTPEITTDVACIQKYGNLELAINTTDLLAAGFAYGDMLNVTVAGQTLKMPLCADYPDVDNGAMVCRADHDETTGEEKVTVAIYMGDLATRLGIAAKTDIEEDPGYRWDYLVDQPVTVTITLEEKGGYAEGIQLHKLVRSNDRADYPNLTDEQYANFRNVATTGMGEGTLYRSSSPVDPSLNRNKEADEAIRKAGVRTIMNMADDEKTMRGYEGYDDTYYSKQDVIALDLSLDFAADDFRENLAKGMEYFASHDGPYLVHCTEGKSRAGFAAAILECLMGASWDEVVADFMVTYYNYYGITPESAQYDFVVNDIITKYMQTAFGPEDLAGADLKDCAEKYLLSIGLTAETIEVLETNLGRSPAQ